MARSLVLLTSFYILGIVFGRFYFSLQASLFLVPGVLVWCLFLLFYMQRGRLLSISVFFLFLAIGSLACNFSLQRTAGNIRDYAGEECTLVGMVADEPLWREGDVVFPLHPGKVIIRGKEYPANGTVRVVLTLVPGRGSHTAGSAKSREETKSTEKNYKRGTSTEGQEDRSGAKDASLYYLSYGRQVSLKGKLYAPQGKRNPGGFAYRDFLETQGMAATFYTEAKNALPLGFSPKLSRLRRAALLVKEKMSAVLRARLPEKEGNLLVGMLFGERSALDPEMESFFARSGVAHLLAVSGLHVGLVAGFLLFFWRRIAGQGWCAFLLSALFLFLYVFLCGLKPAALRALFMFLLAAGALFFDRQNDLPTALAAAAFFTLLYNPLYLFTTSFQLSYAATGGLIFFAPYLQQKIDALFAGRGGSVFSFVTGKVTPLLAVTLAAQIGVLPLTAYYFREISLVALFTNLLILPVMALVLGIGLLSILPGLFWSQAGAFFNLANYPLLSYILFVTSQAGSLPFAYCRVFPPHLPELCLYYAFLAALISGGRKHLFFFYYYLRERIRPSHFLIFFLLAALVITWQGLPGMPAARGRNLEIVFLDVGQGDAIFIRTPRGRNILVDGGGKPAYRGDIAETGHLIVVPFLEYRRVKKLDLVMISHPHEDHYGGLFAVFERFPVKVLATNAESPGAGFYHELLFLAQENNIPREILWEGDRFMLEPSLELRIFNPPRELWRGTESDANNNSLVLHLRYKETGLLLTGDVEMRAVEYFLKRDNIPACQVLKIPHHGGALPNLVLLLEKLAPGVAVISTGVNSFGHPHPDTLAVLEEKGVQIYRTDLHGAVTLQSNGYTWKAKTMLLQQKNPQKTIFSPGLNRS